MGKFEDRLLLDLMEEHGDDLANARRPTLRRAVPRPMLVAAGAAALAGIATTGTIAVSGGSSPAYAVTRHANGTVTVSLRDLAAVDDANARFRQLGVPVRAAAMRPDCTETVTVDGPGGPKPRRPSAIGYDKSLSAITVPIRHVPDGDVIVLVAQSSHGDGDGVTVSELAGYVRLDAVPSCLPTD